MRYEERKGYRRSARVADVLQQVIAEAIERRIDDPRVGFVTVTKVDAAPNLKTAKVFVSVLGGDAEAHARAIEALNELHGTIQREIARHMRIMFTPRLTFIEDLGPARADRLGRMLSGQEEEPAP